MNPKFKHQDKLIDQEFTEVYKQLSLLMGQSKIGVIEAVMTSVPYDDAVNEDIVTRVGFLLTNGQEVAIATYPILYNILGISFNTASTLDGNFNVPTITKLNTYIGFAIRAK